MYITILCIYILVMGEFKSVLAVKQPDTFLPPTFCEAGVVGEDSEAVGKRDGSDSVLSLHGQGQHRILQYQFVLRDSHPSMKSVDLAIVHVLPTVWFVDPFEAHRVVGSNSSIFESHILDKVDLEAIEIFSNPMSHALVAKNISLHADGVAIIDVGIRIHARYAEVSPQGKRCMWEWLLSDMVPVVFEPFHMYLRSPSGHCIRMTPAQDALSTTVPAGVQRHAHVVVLVTAFSVVLGFMLTVYTFIQNSSVGEMKSIY